jgi:hypothetical protein
MNTKCHFENWSEKHPIRPPKILDCIHSRNHGEDHVLACEWTTGSMFLVWEDSLYHGNKHFKYSSSMQKMQIVIITVGSDCMSKKDVLCSISI